MSFEMSQINQFTGRQTEPLAKINSQQGIVSRCLNCFSILLSPRTDEFHTIIKLHGERPTGFWEKPKRWTLAETGM